MVKNSARAFVRVTFLTKAKQTLVVEDSQNPVWNETLIFDKVENDGDPTAGTAQR